LVFFSPVVTKILGFLSMAN